MPLDLFGSDTQESPPSSARKRATGYPCPPGTGPEGETCGTCKNLYRHRMANVYFKCLRMRGNWTGGPGTDIKFRSPACKLWEEVDRADVR